MSKLSSIVFPVRFVNLQQGWFLLGSEETVDNSGNRVPAEITLFAHWSGARRPSLRGDTVVLDRIPGREVRLPKVGTLVEVVGEIVDPLPGKPYSQVTGWAISEECVKACASADKARQTLANLAAKAAEENRLRQQAKANSCRKGATAGGKKRKTG